MKLSNIGIHASVPITSLIARIVSVLGLALLVSSYSAAQVTTSQYDNARTGANLSEAILKPQNVNQAQFGKVFSLRVEGDIYAQPLYLPHLTIPGKGVHNVLFVATEHDSVYAFDADGGSTAPLWQVSFIKPDQGITTVPVRDVQCPFIRPEVGITSTPVIDAASGVIYVLARTMERDGAARPKYVQRLHALDVTTGAEKLGGPVVIDASVKGTGPDAKQGVVNFDPLRENQRVPLALVNGKVYIAWASSCDVGPYHGWVMAYDAHSLAQVAVFNTSPDNSESGIWQGDAAPAADNEGNIYLATGNGKFDVAASGRDYGDSVLKLGLSQGNLEVRDYFTPFNQEEMNREDADLGSGGPVLLPEQPGPHPHMLVVGGKDAKIYVLDRDHLGKFHPGSNENAIQTIQVAGMAMGAAAYWNKHVYLICSDDVIKDFVVQNGHLSPEPATRGNRKYIDPGATPTISANGTKDAIVWAIESKGWRAPDRPAVLHAYDATNVGRELYSSEDNSARDRAGMTLRFSIPTVINGRVYVGAKNAVEVYGLLAADQK